jgi:hypothetical protein
MDKAQNVGNFSALAFLGYAELVKQQLIIIGYVQIVDAKQRYNYGWKILKYMD